ncbi:MAG: hypothetical protein OXT70_03180, partial [Chloroflexota bacterium]|nr:hypothetical protein [Chloroflexota bacterium]
RPGASPLSVLGRLYPRTAKARSAPDLVRRDFSAYGPDRMWVADITQVRGGVLQSMGSVDDAYDNAWTVAPSPPVSVRSAARRPSHHHLSARLRGAPARAWMRSLTVNVTRDVRPALRALAAAACRALSHATARKPDRAAGPSHRSRDLLQRWRQSLHRTLGRAMFPLFSAQSEWDCPCSILGEEVLQGRVQYSV